MAEQDTFTEALARATVAGQFALRDRKGASLLPRGRKALGIVAVLLWQRGKKIHREQLTDFFWSDRGRDQGLASLRKSLNEVRVALGSLSDPLLAVDRQYAALRPDRIEFDLWDGDGTARLEASAPLLDGIGPISPVFDDWLDQRRREFRTEQVRAAERRMLKGEPGSDEVLAAADALLLLEPENELAARIAIAGHGARGNIARAKRIHDTVAAALKEQGFDVSPATRAALIGLRTAPAPRTAAALAAPAPAIRPAADAPAEPPTVAIGQIEFVGPDERHLARLFTHSLANRAASISEFHAGLGANMPAADYVLTGIGVPEGERMHLQVGVSARNTGEQIASVETDADVASPIAGAQTLVDRVIARMLPAIEQHAARHLPRDRDSWTACAHYLHARRLIATADGPTYMDEAEPHLRAAVEMQPDFLPPYPYLISSLNSGGRGTRPGADLTEARREAMALARRCLVHDAQNPNAHLALAWCLLRSREFELAEQSLMEVERLRPYDAYRINSLGTAFVVLGDHEKAERYYRRAQEMMVNDLDFLNSDWGELHYFRRDYAAALPSLSMGEVRNPAFGRLLRAATLAQLGRLDEARREAARMLQAVEARWAGAEPFTPEAAIRWYLADFHMRRQVDVDNIREGLSKAGFTL